MEDVPGVQAEGRLDHQRHAHAVQDQAGEELDESAAEPVTEVADGRHACHSGSQLAWSRRANSRGVVMTSTGPRQPTGPPARSLARPSGPPPQPRLRRAGRRDPRPARRRPAPAGHPAARRARAGRGAEGQPDHGHRRVPRAARQRPPDQPPRRRQLDHPARRTPGGQLRAVDPARRPRHDRPRLRRAGRAARADPGRPGRRGGAAALPRRRRLPPDRARSSCARRSRGATPTAGCRPAPTRSWSPAARSTRSTSSLRLTVPAGAGVLVESPTYPNALAALSARRARIATHGLDADARLGRRAAARQACGRPGRGWRT